MREAEGFMESAPRTYIDEAERFMESAPRTYFDEAEGFMRAWYSVDWAEC